MKYKEGQEIWVKGIIDIDGDAEFRDGAGSFIEYIHRDAFHRLDIRTDNTPTIPDYVAEWMAMNPCISWWRKIAEWENKVLSADRKVYDWYADLNENLFMEAWLAYPNVNVEKKILYTVEIPNPNSKGANRFFLQKDPNTGKIFLCKGNFNPDKNKNLWLTEEEIKQDFSWAWEKKFAKEVKE